MTHPYVISIGAAAGGLEEINSFLDYTQTFYASYIIIHHFSPENISTLTELLARHSKLTVKDAANNMPVEASNVYILPYNQLVSVVDYHFIINPQINDGLSQLSIDYFFTSLALCCERKAIGIILSGMGTDGVSGVNEISKTGGTVMVRNPKTTQFSEMPEAAIASGRVDYILEPELMPGVIDSIINGNGNSIKVEGFN